MLFFDNSFYTLQLDANKIKMIQKYISSRQIGDIYLSLKKYFVESNRTLVEKIKRHLQPYYFSENKVIRFLAGCYPFLLRLR